MFSSVLDLDSVMFQEGMENSILSDYAECSDSHGLCYIKDRFTKRCTYIMWLQTGFFLLQTSIFVKRICTISSSKL